MWLTARTRTGIRPGRTVAGTLLVGLLLAGCASPIFAPGGSAAPASDDDPRPLDRVHRQAQDALVRWADAVRESGGASIVFVGDLTSQIGTWEAEVAENNEAALIGGMVQPVTDLSTDRPSRRDVKWLDETKVDVNVLSAAAIVKPIISPRMGSGSASSTGSSVSIGRGCCHGNGCPWQRLHARNLTRACVLPSNGARHVADRADEDRDSTLSDRRRNPAGRAPPRRLRRAHLRPGRKRRAGVG